MAMLTKYFDVRVLHGNDGKSWCDYLIKTFKRPNLEIIIDSINLDKVDHENSPEIEICMRESYAVILLVTEDLINFMESNSGWFPAMFDKRDKELTDIFAVLLCIDQDDCANVCLEKGYKHGNWNFEQMETDGSNVSLIVKNVLEAVDHKTDIHAMLQERQASSNSPEYLVPHICELYPNKVKMSQDPVALIFVEEIDGDITLMFEKSDNDFTQISFHRRNPYCITFVPPVLPQGLYSLHICHDGVEIDMLQIHYSNTEFTSVELLRQCLGASSFENLDEILAQHYKKTICTDDVLKRLVETIDYTNIDTSICHSSILHWAAANGLKELVAEILQSPFATKLLETKNCNGDSVADLALKEGHTDLSEYIRDFTEGIRRSVPSKFNETKHCAELCDLYVQFSNPGSHHARLSSVQEDNESSTDDVYEDMTGVTENFKQQQQQLQQPPVPFRHNRLSSLPQTEAEMQNLPQTFLSAHEFLQLKDEPPLKDGAVGCRSQNELIDIQEEVKAGRLTIDDAQMLFDAWKERNKMTNQSASFKEKTRSLNVLRHQYKNTLSLLTKAKKKLSSVDMEEEQKLPEVAVITEPIVQRKTSVGPKHRRAPPDQMTRTSAGSSRGSNDSGIGRGSNSSGCDYLDVVEHRSTLNSRVASNRNSLFNQFMEEYEEPKLPTSKPPPLPTRKRPQITYSRRKMPK